MRLDVRQNNPLLGLVETQDAAPTADPVAPGPLLAQLFPPGGSAVPEATGSAALARQDIEAAWANVADFDPEQRPDEFNLDWYHDRNVHRLLSKGMPWAVETWLRAVEAENVSPQALGALFAEGAVEALKSDKLEDYAAVMAGLRGLSSARQLARPGSGACYLASRSRGEHAVLETQSGIDMALKEAATTIGNAVNRYLTVVLARLDEAAKIAESLPRSNIIEMLKADVSDRQGAVRDAQSKISSLLGEVEEPQDGRPRDIDELLTEMHVLEIRLQGIAPILEVLDAVSGDVNALITKLETSTATAQSALEQGPLAAAIELEMADGSAVSIFAKVVNEAPTVFIGAGDEVATVSAASATRLRAALKSCSHELVHDDSERRAHAAIDFLLDRMA